MSFKSNNGKLFQIKVRETKDLFQLTIKDIRKIILCLVEEIENFPTGIDVTTPEGSVSCQWG